MLNAPCPVTFVRGDVARKCQLRVASLCGVYTLDMFAYRDLV